VARLLLMGLSGTEIINHSIRIIDLQRQSSVSGAPRNFLILQKVALLFTLRQ